MSHTESVMALKTTLFAKSFDLVVNMTTEIVSLHVVTSFHFKLTVSEVYLLVTTVVMLH